MKNLLKKFFLITIAMVMIITVSGCTGVVIDEGGAGLQANYKNMPYREVLKQLAANYGFPTVKTANYEASYKGILAFDTVDLNDDNKDELLAFVRGADWVSFEIYAMKKGTPQKVYSEAHSGDKAVVKRQKGKTMVFISSGYRSWNAGIIGYQDGEYKNICTGEWTEEETQWVESFGVTGIGLEDDLRKNVYLHRIGLELNDPWEEILTIETGYNGFGDYVTMGNIFAQRASLCTEKLKAYGIVVPEAKVSSTEILGNIPYYGDYTACKMDKQMAEEYLNVLKGKDKTTETYPGEEWSREVSLYAALIDAANDGMPLLMTAYLDTEDPYNYRGVPYHVELWGYKDGKAYSADIPRPDYSNGFGTIDGKTYYRNVEFFHDVGHKRTGKYYLIENGVVTLTDTLDIYDIYISQNGDGEPIISGELPEGESYDITPENLRANGWKIKEDTDFGQYFHLIIHNGENITGNITEFYHDEIMKFEENKALVNCSDAEYEININTKKAEEMIALLEGYKEAVGKPIYSYPEVSTLISTENYKLIEKLAADMFKGKIGEIYKISDDLYYVIIYLDEEPCGGILVKNTDGGKNFKVVESGKEFFKKADLEKFISQDSAQSNIYINTDNTKNFEKEIKNAIKNIDGTVVNNAGKTIISAYVQNYISQGSKTEIKANKGVLTIDGEVLRKAAKKAGEYKTETEEVLEKYNIELNKTPTVVFIIVCRKANINNEVRLILDSSILQEAENFDRVKFEIENTGCSVIIDADNLKDIINRYGSPSIVLSQTEENTYSIKFVTEDGEIIYNLKTPVEFNVPAFDELCTVQAEYVGGTDNWGGQYNSAEKTIMFETPYSGTYKVVDNAATINDIDNLSDEQKKAIEFMVSKGYLTLEGDNFGTGRSLTRYEFTQALVGMFFALDRDIKTTFNDVPEESLYYPYVASAQKDGIVEGFTKDTFGGEIYMTTEQMIGLAGRTLISRKGYIVPEDKDHYLDSFEDSNMIEDWAREYVALAVREGLIDRGGKLMPQSEISREQAALILYRLFLLLYDVAPVESVAATPSVAGTVGVVAGASAGVGGIVAAIWYFIRKRKTII